MLHERTRALALPTCAIYLYDESRRALVPRAAYGGGDEEHHKHSTLDREALRAAFYRHSFPIDEPYGAHLSQLRRAGLVESNRRGMNVYHRPHRDALGALCVVLDPNCCT